MLLSLLAVSVTLTQTFPLEGDTFHVQGIAVDGTRLWVTAVETKAKKGWLFEYEIPSGKRTRAVEVTAGTCFHPGGLDQDETSLWIPVAEYRASSKAVIQRRAKSTLEILSSFEVADHIGAVAAAKGKIFGANWDARKIYEWDDAGKSLRVRDNPLPAGYQDIKWRGGQLVASGLPPKPKTGGVIHWLDPKTLTAVESLEFGLTDRNKAFTNEGMDLQGDRLYLLPEDAPSRLFVYAVTR